MYSCKKVGIPTYRPQLARLSTSEGFSPNRQSFRVPKRQRRFLLVLKTVTKIPICHRVYIIYPPIAVTKCYKLMIKTGVISIYVSFNEQIYFNSEGKGKGTIK